MHARRRWFVYLGGMTQRVLWFAMGAIGCASLLFAQEAVGDWAERLSRWSAVRDVDAPVRNGFHIRQTLTINNLFGLQTQFYSVPTNRRLLLEQMAVYCNFGNFNFNSRIDQVHVSTVSSGAAARYPIARTVFDANRDFLAGQMRLYADGDTPVLVNLVFAGQTNAQCEITATGQLVQLAQ